jgi:hypothetical protein
MAGGVNRNKGRLESDAMHRRSFLLSLFGGLAAASGMISASASAEAAPAGLPLPREPATPLPEADLGGLEAAYASSKRRRYYLARRRYYMARRRRYYARRRYYYDRRRYYYARRRYYDRRRSSSRRRRYYYF